MSKGFHEKLLKFATDMGMGGLGYLEVDEAMAYKGPIDKFIPEELKKELAGLAELSAGDTIFFIADKEEKAAYYAGRLRTELGEKLELIEKNVYRFCYVNDFPMFELDADCRILICTSRSCCSVTSFGAPHMKSCAVPLIGKAMTSRMFSSPRRSMIMRSTPGAMPACGGAPN